MHFDDSELNGAEWEDHTLVLRFSVVSADRNDGAGWQSGLLSGVSLRLKPTRALATCTDLIGRIRHGRLFSAGQSIGPLPLPSALSGPLQLELQLANGSTLTVEAEGLEACWQAPLSWHESYAC
ncbi:hypothetical protein [Ideonella sp.]|uniref:hypothetical protein n=1 Tax=Ideonella sp. TaxID=1929293 RepID=UPI003BB61B88